MMSAGIPLRLAIVFLLTVWAAWNVGHATHAQRVITTNSSAPCVRRGPTVRAFAIQGHHAIAIGVVRCACRTRRHLDAAASAGSGSARDFLQRSTAKAPETRASPPG